MIILSAAVLLIGAVKADSGGSRELLQLRVSVSPEQVDLNQSYITIHSSTYYAAGMGENISIPLHVYRGNTLKRTVYIWIEDSEGVRVSTKGKISLPDRFTSYNLTANISFNRCIIEGRIVVEGLGINVTKPVGVALEGCEEDEQEETGAQGISFSIVHTEKEIISGRPFRTTLRIENPTGQNITVDSWSYVYRQSVSYSGEREQNRKTINLPEFSNVTFDLENTVDAPSGEYSFKVLFQRSDRKTPHEIRLQLNVTSNENAAEKGKSLSIDMLGSASSDGLTADQKMSDAAGRRTLFSSNLSSSGNSSGTVYLSSSARARKLTVYFLILVLAMILVALMFRRL